jgi:tRNA-2-methylthio-N6-dimethylallyladenosine synthase
MNKTYHITTFGCQMNEHDSEIIAGFLEDMGYTPEEKEKAGVEVINTCSVRENADKRFFGTLGQLKHRKEEDPDYIVCVCGCMMQQKRVTDLIDEKYPWVDIVFGTNNLYRFPHLLRDAVSRREREREVWKDAGSIEEGLPSVRKYKHKAFVNIMYGCNNFCTYCIVPYTRGRERSRRPEDIISEISRLAADGVKEVMLLGQNVNSYDGGITFAELLKRTAEVDGIERIRFMTSNPKDLSDELIETIASCDKVCDNIHLPMQSGSDRILKKMNRHYTFDSYLALVERLRAAVPDITLSTDIIVGFPGETEEDFQRTLDLVEAVRYDSAFTFLYSIRQGTPAAEYPDQIPEDVKHERFNRLVELVDSISAEKNKAYEGRIERVLVEGTSKRDPSAVSGRTEGFKLVNFRTDRDLTGKFADVRITKGKTFSLEGELI